MKHVYITIPNRPGSRGTFREKIYKYRQKAENGYEGKNIDKKAWV
jgi:hypothetical protein